MKRLLVLNFFPAFYPPQSGGELRYYHLYAELSRFYDVTLLSPTYPDHAYKLVEFSRRFREHRIPKEQIHLELHQTLGQTGIGPECSALVCALASCCETAYHHKYRELVADADAVIHEFPYMLNYDEEFGRDGKPRIYSSHNLEAQLAAHMFPGAQGEKYVRFVSDLERHLVLDSDLVFASSETERDAFRTLYGCPDEKLALAPNGCVPIPNGRSEAVRPQAKRRLKFDPDTPLAIFLGSGHPPNIEAARYLCEHVAPALPEVQIAIAGSVCKMLPGIPPNVRAMGLISDTEKEHLFQACDVALNPMFSGAGTNLKLLDYMANGIPTVTTVFGARGLPLEDQKHCLLADAERFVAAVDALLRDPLLQTQLGSAASELANSQFTWAAIAKNVHSHIDRLFEAHAPALRSVRKRLLVLNGFPVAAATQGGEVRIQQLFTRLSGHYEVTLLCLSYDLITTEVRITDHFIEVRVPKTDAHRIAEADLNSRHLISTNDIVSALQCRGNPELVAQYRRLLRNTDIVILEHPYLAPLLDLEHPSVPVIYEAHNVESSLKSKILGDHPDRSQLLECVEKVETRACAVASRILCVSSEDRAEFAKQFDAAKIVAVVNGVDTKPYVGSSSLGTIREVFRGRPVAVFLGSGHPPNLDAARFIIEKLCPKHPEITFLIVGSCCDAFRRQKVPSNLLLCGVVTRDEKELLLLAADVALNPMQSGGGSSLKVAEYLAAGLPVLSTPIGVRGYNLTAGTNVIVADLEAFSESLATLIDDSRLRQQLRDNGQRYARQHLDWDSLAERYREIIEGIRSERKRRLLVTTFRFTDPPLGGAETYLLEILKQLHELGRFTVDVATFDVGTITNHLHFSAKYGPGGHATPPYVNRVYGFTPDRPPQREVMQNCRRLFAVWQQEDLAHGRRLARHFTEPVLLGGWFHPERYGSTPLRWTGDLAEIYCPSEVEALSIAGYSKGKTALSVTFEDRPLHAETVRGNFCLRLDLRGLPAGILQLRADARHRSRHDPRKLGVCVTQIKRSDGTEECDVPLEDDFAAKVRRKDPAAWVFSLIEITRARDPTDDVLFQEVRGPSSKVFEEWLHCNLQNYDLVLAHGTPFSPMALTARAAARAGVTYVVLPHYHMDDKYYHWRHYYEAFRSAALVLSAPDGAKPLFFDRLGAPAVSVPGGAVDPDEFLDLAAVSRQFRRVHARTRPFVLVLGRKAGAKHYDRVLNAVAAINAGESQGCDVVMIGPEEDGRRIDDRNVFYYGAQPRSVVLGALAECLCLATMSESESFGIVLLEAWMSERAVVANRSCPAFAELVTHGEDGFLCATDGEITEALAKLLSTPGLTAELGRRGRRKVLERFTWRHVAMAMASALAEAAAIPEGRDIVESRVLQC